MRPSFKIAMLNGKHETTAPWYQRASYAADLGHWNVDGYLITTKMEVVFDAAPESEFLDFRASLNENYPINNWALYAPFYDEGPPLQPLFYGTMCDPFVMIQKHMVVAFNIRIDLVKMSPQARYATWHVMFGLPKRQGA